MRSRLIWVAALLGALGVAQAARAQNAPGDFYDIPVVQSLTGGGAFLGMEEHDALQLVEKLTNRTGGIHGKTLRFVFHDDQSSPQNAIQLANEALATKPIALHSATSVVPSTTMGFVASASLATKPIVVLG